MTNEEFINAAREILLHDEVLMSFEECTEFQAPLPTIRFEQPGIYLIWASSRKGDMTVSLNGNQVMAGYGLPSQVTQVQVQVSKGDCLTASPGVHTLRVQQIR